MFWLKKSKPVLIKWHFQIYCSFNSLTYLSQSLGFDNEICIDENVLIHLDSDRRIPIGKELTTPSKNIFSVEKLPHGILKVKLHDPPTVEPEKALPIDDLDLPLYQSYRKKKGSFEREPHRFLLW